MATLIRESYLAPRRDAWAAAIFAMLGIMCGPISVVLVNTGIFMKPLGASLGWSRGEISLSLSIGALAMAAANPIVGRLVDRVGVRRMLIWSQILYGASTAATPLLIRATGLPGLYLGFALISGLGAGASVIGYIRLLTGWFIGPLLGSRGFALGCAAAGVALGNAVTGPLALLLINQFGWQGGFVGLSLLPLLVGLPMSLFCIREAPTDEASHAETGDVAILPGMTLKQAANTTHFWLMIAMVLLISSCTQGLSIHIAPFLSDAGLSTQGLAAITAFGAFLTIFARIGAGFLFDRFFAPRVAIAIFALPAAAAALMAGFPILSVGLVGSVMLGLGQGAESDFIGYLIGRYFGLRHYGEIFGVVYGMFMVGIAIGPLLFGMAYDAFGDYRMPFLVATIGLTTLCVILALLPRFPEQEQPHA